MLPFFLCTPYFLSIFNRLHVYHFPGEVYFYEYDDTGRLTDVTLPTGENIGLEATVDSKGAKITLSQNSAVAGIATYNGNALSLWHGKLINCLLFYSQY